MSDDTTPESRIRNLTIRYGLAVLVPLAAVYLRVLLIPLLGNQNTYLTVWAAIVFSAWYCGAVAAILSTLIALFAVWFWLLPKGQTFYLMPVDAYSILGVALFSAIIIAIAESARGAGRRSLVAEREAQRTKSLFEAFMDNSPAMTYLKDERGQIVYANRTFRNRFHLSDIGDQGVAAPGFVSEYRENDKFVMEQGRACEFVEHSREADGEHVWLTVKFPVRDASGRRLIGGKSFDITDRHRAEEALREARQELELRVQERTAELSRANQSLRELSARLLQMRDEERRRLARELHDSVGQLVAALGMNVGRMQASERDTKEEHAKLIDDTAVLVTQIAAEIRTISHLLHPPLLDEVGLVSALQWYVAEFSKRSAIETRIECPADLGRLPADMEIAIFRIVQECLGNIHRHSGSPSAVIQFERNEHRIVVKALDSGKGVTPDKIAGILDGRGGVGFRGMKERVRFLGGDLAIDSNPNGTVVTAILPLASAGNKIRREEVA